MSLEDDIERLTYRVDFFESCVDQLKREIPKYLKAENEIGKAKKSLSKVLRGVASSETNPELQNVLFVYGQKQEVLQKEIETFADCQKKMAALMDESQSLLIAPLRETVSDLIVCKKKAALHHKKGISELPPEVRSIPFMQSSLHIHAKLYEKHRVRNIKAMLDTMVTTELRYHCRAIEELSAIKAALAQCCTELEEDNSEDEDEGDLGHMT